MFTFDLYMHRVTRMTQFVHSRQNIGLPNIRTKSAKWNPRRFARMSPVIIPISVGVCESTYPRHSTRAR